MKKIKVAVIGVGYLGEFHADKYHANKSVDLIGVVDLDRKRRDAISKKLNISSFSDYTKVLDYVDAVSISVPTDLHFKIGKFFIENGKHVLIEKPFTNNLSEAIKLKSIAKKKGVVLQIGHIERFNKAYIKLEELVKNPLFIECNRISPFKVRGTEVDVIMDLMIHDLDIVLHVVKSPVKSINASGVSVLSNTPDIANARLEFENGCIANLTSSRISLKKMRKTRIFQEDAYISINFLEKDFQVVKIRDKHKGEAESSLIVKNNLGEEKVIFFENPEVQSINSIEAELNDFYGSIKFKSDSKVSLNDGIKALEVAEEIMRQL